MMLAKPTADLSSAAVSTVVLARMISLTVGRRTENETQLLRTGPTFPSRFV